MPQAFGELAFELAGAPSSPLLRGWGFFSPAGCQIPYIKGKTVSGANGDWYFFRLADLSEFLQGQWGAAETLNPDGWKAALAGQSGIIQYEIQWSDATGHMSLWNGATNVDGPKYDYSNPDIRHNAPFNGVLFWPLN
ncbi:MAG TPA: T6SS effector amidase Tae4 family protein [Candidatus Acidoferrales bacterium]|nr:T6SS effector amidase Tae4 family protein [Candidatus Acidoferrales bacterium]